MYCDSCYGQKLCRSVCLSVCPSVSNAKNPTSHQPILNLSTVLESLGEMQGYKFFFQSNLINRKEIMLLIVTFAMVKISVRPFVCPFVCLYSNAKNPASNQPILNLSTVLESSGEMPGYKYIFKAI